MLATPEECKALTVEIENSSKDVFTWLNSLGQNPKAPADRCVCELHRHGAEGFEECADLKKYPAMEEPQVYSRITVHVEEEE
jgi:hypothetical protein